MLDHFGLISEISLDESLLSCFLHELIFYTRVDYTSGVRMQVETFTRSSMSSSFNTKQRRNFKRDACTARYVLFVPDVHRIFCLPSASVKMCDDVLLDYLLCHFDKEDKKTNKYRSWLSFPFSIPVKVIISSRPTPAPQKARLTVNNEDHSSIHTLCLNLIAEMYQS